MIERLLSISIGGLAFVDQGKRALGARGLIEWVAGLGSKERPLAVQLDGTIAGVRARELDRSARRDLASMMRRLGLAFTGVDLFVPPTHFAAVEHVDRAMAALAGAISLAADLATLSQSTAGRVVCVELPEALQDTLAGAIAAAAERESVHVADFAISRMKLERMTSGGGIGTGVDPAALLMAGIDPVDALAKLREAPVAARLCDAGIGGRCNLGRGRLERAAYDATLATKGFTGALVVDLRGLADADIGARAAIGE